MESLNWRQIVASLFGIVALALLGYFGQAKARTGSTPPAVKAKVQPLATVPAPKPTDVADANTPTTAPDRIYLDISGEVLKPGYYWLPSGARLNDLVELAGGLSRSADRDRINMALILKDGQKIVIPAVRAAVSPQAPTVAETGVTEPPPQESALTSQPKEVSVVSINSASKVEFEGLPGIGAAIAERIVQYREQVGGFRSIEELKQVRGLGDKLFEKIRDRVQL